METDETFENENQMMQLVYWFVGYGYTDDEIRSIVDDALENAR